MVKFLDLRATYAELKAEIDTSILRVINSGQYIGGSEVENFESEFAAYCGAEYAIGVNSGLDALCLAIQALGIQPGDEVIVPAHTFIATWLAVTRCGGIIKSVEPKPDTFNIDSLSINKALTKKTKLIIPVHLYGQPAQLNEIVELAANNEIPVLADAAQAHGARYQGMKIGSEKTHANCWSFYPGKNLGAFGDAGAITCADSELSEKLQLLRNYGSKQKYVHDIQGGNSRLDPIQAAVLRVKLRKLDEWNTRREKIAALYNSELADTPVVIPKVPDFARPCWHLYVIKAPKRNELMQYLKGHGIETLIHYPIPPALQSAYSKSEYDGTKTAKTLCEQILSLPIGPHLLESDAKRVAVTIRQFYDRR
jgi:dTDP-4-amino-4,6-dideoxygalactose transaminase